MLFLKIARTRSPSTTVSRGPGHVPLNPRPAIGSFFASIWCWISSIVMSKTFTPSTTLGSSGTLPGLSIDAPSPPRKRSTTARALASWSIAGADADGAADGSSLIAGDSAGDAAAEADGEAAADAAGEPLGADD